MILLLPMTPDNPQSFVTQLGNTNYRFELRWNSRSNVWTMDISNPVTQAPIISGIALVLGADLLAAYALGMGGVVVWDETGTGTEASLSSLGTSTNVYWISPDEFPADSPDA